MDDGRDERKRALISELRASGGLSEKSLTALARVDRHLFVPPEHRDQSYENHPLPIGLGQTISQPFMVGWLIDAAGADAGMRILEIGTGCGYQAAVLAETGAEVWSVEIRLELAAEARTRLDFLGYQRVQTKAGNGWHGWPEAGPFDAIILTAAPEFIAENLVGQLAEGGVLVAPVGAVNEIQELIRVVKGPDGSKIEEKLGGCRFVPMIGAP